MKYNNNTIIYKMYEIDMTVSNYRTSKKIQKINLLIRKWFYNNKNKG
jgi:hypothetical protein